MLGIEPFYFWTVFVIRHFDIAQEYFRKNFFFMKITYSWEGTFMTLLSYAVNKKQSCIELRDDIDI